MIDRPARVGIATRISGSCVRRATRIMTGTKITNPTSKNIGRPIKAPMRAMIQAMVAGEDFATRVLTTWSVAPVSMRTLPIMAPRPMRMPTDPMVLPNSLVKLASVETGPSPEPMPTTKLAQSKDMKGCSLTTVTKKIRTTKLRTRLMLNRVLSSLMAGLSDSSNELLLARCNIDCMATSSLRDAGKLTF